MKKLLKPTIWKFVLFIFLLGVMLALDGTALNRNESDPWYKHSWIIEFIESKTPQTVLESPLADLVRAPAWAIYTLMWIPLAPIVFVFKGLFHWKYFGPVIYPIYCYFVSCSIMYLVEKITRERNVAT